MNYHYPHQQYHHQPFPTTFPLSTPYTLPPPVLQALHRLATFSSNIQLLTSHFAPHLYLNSSYTSFAKPTFQDLTRRRKPTPRSTAWRLQNSPITLPPNPGTRLPIATAPLSSLIPTPISTLPPRPVSAPPVYQLESAQHGSSAVRSRSMPPLTAFQSRSRLQVNDLQQPRSCLPKKIIDPSSCKPLAQPNIESNTTEVASTTTIAPIPSDAMNSTCITKVEFTPAPVVLSEPTISSAIDLLPIPTIKSVPTVHTVLESQSIRGTTIDPIVDPPNPSIHTFITVDLAPGIEINPIDPISDINLRQTSTTPDIDQKPTVSAVDLDPNIIVDPAPSVALNDTGYSEPSASIDPVLDCVTVRSDLLSVVVESSSSVSDVPLVPSTSSHLSNSGSSLTNITSTSINKKKKKKKKTSKLATITPSSESPDPETIVANSALELSVFDPATFPHVPRCTREWVFNTQDGWFEVDMELNEYVDEELDNKHQENCLHEQLLFIDHLLDRHPDYILGEKSPQGILLGKDCSQEIIQQDVICYDLFGKFLFKRENGEVFHHLSYYD